MTCATAAALLVVLGMPSVALAAQAWDAPSGPNLVSNPSLEEIGDGRVVGWDAPTAVYSSDALTAARGVRSLKFVNQDSANYVLCTQSIPLRPGLIYEVKALVRTQGLAGDDSGATVCVEWSDSHGRYLGGCYPEGRKGDTSEWTEVRGLTEQIPAEAARFTVSCYVRKGMVGTAWWDEVSVRRWRQRPLETLLVSPSYRGLIWTDGPTLAEVRVRLREQDLEGGASGMAVRARVTAAGGREVIAERRSQGAAEETRLRLALPRLDPGKYRLSIQLVRRADGEVLAEDSYELERQTGPKPRSFLDAHRRLIVDGQPFFPLGMYWSAIDEEQLRVYKEAPFNCLMPYQAPDRTGLDLLEKMGLKAIYSIKDYYHGTRWCPDFIASQADEEGAVRSKVQEYRDHPALLAWYLNDELPLDMRPRLEAHQRWVEEEDPDHPTWVVLYQVGDIPGYVRSFDVIGTDPYPIPDRPPSLAGQWAGATRQAVAGSRAIWMVPQVFRWPEKSRGPDLAEMRSMTWQCITEGATGIVFYSWFDLQGDSRFPFDRRWPEVVQVAKEVSEMAPVLLSIEPAPDVDVSGPKALHWAIRSYQGIAYLIMVNDSREPIDASVRFRARPRRVTLRGSSTKLASDGTLTATVEPLGVSIYRVAM